MTISGYDSVLFGTLGWSGKTTHLEIMPNSHKPCFKDFFVPKLTN